MPARQVYPYLLLRGLAISLPNQVWCANITYLRLAHGFVYLTALTRDNCYVLAWKVSVRRRTEEAFCVSAL